MHHFYIALQSQQCLWAQNFELSRRLLWPTPICRPSVPQSHLTFQHQSCAILNPNSLWAGLVSDLPWFSVICLWRIQRVCSLGLNSKSSSFFASFDSTTLFVHLTVSHLIIGEPWSMQMFCVEWKMNCCHNMTTITLPGLCNITICFSSSLTRSKHQEKGTLLSAWSCSLHPPVKREVLAATVACLGDSFYVSELQRQSWLDQMWHIYINLY